MNYKRSEYPHFHKLCLVLNEEKIKKELKNQKNIINQLGIFYSSFIKWCAKQRTIYKADLLEELKEFRKEIIEKRLYNTDIKLWKEISCFIFKKFNYTCQYCGESNGMLQVDHIIPVSKGGTNDLKNLTCACRRCNIRKKNHISKEWHNG